MMCLSVVLFESKLFGILCIWDLNVYLLPKIKEVFLFIYVFIYLLFKYSCLHNPATTFPCPTHHQLPLSILPHFSFVHGSFIHVPQSPFPFFPCYLPPTSPLVIVRLLLTSMYLVISYVLFPFVDCVPVKGEIIRYWSLTLLAYFT